MNQTDKAKRFAELHVKGAPLLLYNAWDAGSAKSIRDAGSPAIATSSWAVAEAQGYRDGESIPLPFAEQIIARIAASVDESSNSSLCAGMMNEIIGYFAPNVIPAFCTSA